jgi:ABC-type multidrug transport system fused ATPase/permease subunit
MIINQAIKIFNILENEKKKNFLFFFFLSIINIFFEVIGISMIIPITQLLVNPDFLIQNNFISSILNFFMNFFFEGHVFSNNNLVLILLIIFFFIILFKNFFILLSINFKNNFLYKLSFDLKCKLLNHYFSLPFLLYKNKESSKIFLNINNLVDHILILLESYLVIIIEIFLMFSIFLLIFLFDPKLGFFLIFFLATFVLVVNLFLRKKTIYLGKLRNENTQNQIKFFDNIINGFQEIKLINNLDFFLNKFKHSVFNVFVSNKKYIFFISLPRILLEITFCSAIIFIFIYYIFYNIESKDVVVVFSLLLVSFIRVMPSVTKIISNKVNLDYYQNSFETIFAELHESNEKIYSGNRFIKLHKSFSLKKVNFEYNKKVIFKNLNLDLNKGETIGILGNSGIGKSTLLNIILGFIKPTSGSILIDGKLVDYNYLLDKVGLVKQSNFIINDSIKNNIILGRMYADEELNKVINHVGLEDLVKQLPEGIESLVGDKGSKLSGGEIQRIAIARAIINNPDILVLDEATNALDIKMEEYILNNIFNSYKKKVIIIVSHKKNVINMCKKKFLLKNFNLISI